MKAIAIRQSFLTDLVHTAYYIIATNIMITIINSAAEFNLQMQQNSD